MRDVAAPDGPAPGPADLESVLAAVFDDIRQTLRTAWVDPALHAASSSPAFFTAAWSAIRPNVGRSFLTLARALRGQAVESLRVGFDLPDLRRRLEGMLSDGELRRVEESIVAAHLAAAKTQIVVHAFARAARRERISGTGKEESPVRRGVPEWQRWITVDEWRSAPPGALAEAEAALAVPGGPVSLRLLARWKPAVETAWDAVRPHVGTDRWRAAAMRLRRAILAGVSTLPHPVDLQWTALRRRGFSEQEQDRLTALLDASDATAPDQTLVAAFLWRAFGSPDTGPEGS